MAGEYVRVTVRMTKAQHNKLKFLGGSEWLRGIVEQAFEAHPGPLKRMSMPLEIPRFIGDIISFRRPNPFPTNSHEAQPKKVKP